MVVTGWTRTTGAGRTGRRATNSILLVGCYSKGSVRLRPREWCNSVTRDALCCALCRAGLGGVDHPPVGGSGCQYGRLWWGEHGHGGFGQVAAVADLPFVVRLDQDTHDENRCRATGLEKIPTTSVRLLTSRPALSLGGQVRAQEPDAQSLTSMARWRWSVPAAP